MNKETFSDVIFTLAIAGGLAYFFNMVFQIADALGEKITEILHTQHFKLSDAEYAKFQKIFDYGDNFEKNEFANSLLKNPSRHWVTFIRNPKKKSVSIIWDKVTDRYKRFALIAELEHETKKMLDAPMPTPTPAPVKKAEPRIDGSERAKKAWATRRANILHQKKVDALKKARKAKARYARQTL